MKQDMKVDNVNPSVAQQNKDQSKTTAQSDQ
jgi:hypothetical protein